jgi:hypothetical protein
MGKGGTITLSLFLHEFRWSHSRIYSEMQAPFTHSSVVLNRSYEKSSRFLFDGLLVHYVRYGQHAARCCRYSACPKRQDLLCH